MPVHVQAYCKIVGLGWEYYMTKPQIFLGRSVRGSTSVECDVELTSESAVSRQHFTIRFVPEQQALEVKNLSKNGTLVNGTFVSPYCPPVLLRSQTQINYGRTADAVCHIILPPASVASNAPKPKYLPPKSRTPLLQCVGTVLIYQPMTIAEICLSVRKAYVRETSEMDKITLFNSVRHIVAQNDHIFVIYQDPYNDPPVVIPQPSPRMELIRFHVRPAERDRFMKRNHNAPNGHPAQS